MFKRCSVENQRGTSAVQSAGSQHPNIFARVIAPFETDDISLFQPTWRVTGIPRLGSWPSMCVIAS